MAIELIFLSIGMYPANGAEGVLVACRCRRTCHQTVFDGHGEETELRPSFDSDGKIRLAAIAVMPAPAVNTEDDREGAGAGRHGYVGDESGAQDFTIDDGLHGHWSPFG